MSRLAKWVAVFVSLSIGGASALARPLRRHRPASFVEFHSARVKRDLMIFHPELPGMEPLIKGREPQLDEEAAASLSFVPPPLIQDPLSIGRARDRLLLFRPREDHGRGQAIGVALFALATILSAHAPPPFRLLFDGPVHVGPAIFDDGGMGAGIAGSGL